MIRISPSKLEGCSYCPCYNRYEGTDRSAADEGTLMHKAAETGDMSHLETDDQANMVKMSLDYVENLKAGHSPDVTVFKELKLGASDRTNLPPGTIDCLLVSAKKVDVVDYKFGRKFLIDASSNLQLKCYAAKAFVQFLPRKAPGVKELTGHLLSPRLNDISTAVFTRSVVEDIQKDIKEIEGRIMEPFKQPDPSRPDLCAQCANLTNCPAICKSVQVATKLLALPIPEAFVPGANVTPEDRSLQLQIGEVFASWNDQARRYNKEFVAAGGTIPGYSMVKRAGSTKLTNMQEVAARMVESKLIENESEILSVCSSTLAKLAKLVGDDDLEGSDTKAEIKTALGDLVTDTPEIEYLMRSRKKEDKAKMLANPFKEKKDE